MNMKKNIDLKKSFFWNTFNSLGRLFITFLSTVLLARILTPQDFGTYGVLLIFVTLSESLADSGMGGYLIKKQNSKDIDFDTLFVYNLVVSLILYLILFFSAPVIAKFYNDQTLITSTRILGLVIIIQSLSITANSKLLKEFSYKTLALSSIFSVIIGLLISIVWAIIFGGYMSLIVQSLASVTANTIWLILAVGKFPRLRFSLLIFKEQFSFGINLTCSTILQSITSNICNNIIAKIFNLSISGQYFQASKLQAVPNLLVQNIIDRTYFPVFSKMNNDLTSLRQASSHMGRIVYLGGFFLLSSIVYFAYPIILIILGSQWLDCIPMFKLIMISSFPILVKYVNRNLLKSLGQTNSIFMCELIALIPLILFLVFGILSKNIYIIIFSIIISQSVSSFFSLYFVVKKVGFNAKTIVMDILTFLPFAVIPVVVSFFIDFSVYSVVLYLLLSLVLIIVYRFYGNKEIIFVLNMLSVIKHRIFSNNKK